MIKSLSNDITLSLSTTNIHTGYVYTGIYKAGIGVFKGRSFVDSSHNAILINLNEICSQNRNKYDYLKLDDNGNVVNNETVSYYGQDSKFKRGQIDTYLVNIEGRNLADTDDIYVSESISVLTGYDYPNKDLKPNVNTPGYTDTSVTRIMQGSQWYVNSNSGEYYNLLLPHYPNIKTTKYGVGLEIQTNLVNTDFKIISDTPNASLDLGYTFVGEDGAAMFYSDLSTLLNPLNLSNEDNNIYLTDKNYSDPFVNKTYLTKYFANFVIDHIIVKKYDADTGTLTATINMDRNDGRFGTYFYAYVQIAIDNLNPASPFYNINEWNTTAIINNANTVVYTTPDCDRTIDVEYYMENYQTFYRAAQEVGDIELDGNNDTVQIVMNIPQGIQTKQIVDSISGKCKVAVIEACPARYYLAWNDRYGDIQSQPFDGKIVYSEDIETEEIKDYKLRRKVTRKLVQPKWKLNTKWITEDIYPIYESIFVSPYLLLYDTQQDKSWNVIVTDSEYTEKTRKNDKMINLEINVEANLKQNNIY